MRCKSLVSLAKRLCQAKLTCNRILVDLGTATRWDENRQNFLSVGPDAIVPTTNMAGDVLDAPGSRSPRSCFVPGGPKTLLPSEDAGVENIISVRLETGGPKARDF